MTAPEVQRNIDILKGHSVRGYDSATLSLIDTLFARLHLLRQTDEDTWQLWLRAERGTIEDYGDYQELLEEGEVDSYEEFESYWREDYPDTISWFHFCAIERADGYRAVFLGRSLVLELSPAPEPAAFPIDIHAFVQWLLQAVCDCVERVRVGSYNKMVRDELPVQHRTGTILRRDLWEVLPDLKKDFFAGLSDADADEFLRLVDEPGPPALPSMTANDFYRACTLGYAANDYDGQAEEPRAQYRRHADGRDDGLGDIDPDSPDAFLHWLEHREMRGGHPWEVARGGNSTHISLYVHHNEDGFSYTVSGSSVGRCVEAIKFFLALRRAGLPAIIEEGALLAKRITGEELVGVVPEGILPVYCQGMFPGENIIDFANLDHEVREEMAAKCQWRPEPEVNLI